MSKFLGLGVLILGVGALGYYARANNAVDIQAMVTERAAASVAGSVHGVLSEVSGRDIRLTGLADTEAERAALVAAADAVEGRRVVIDALTVLPVAAPYTANVVKTEGAAALAGTGSVPSEAARADLAGAGWGDAATALTLASGAPEGWMAMAKAGVAALGPLISGEMMLSDASLTVKGVALSPAEYDAMQAALAGLPADAVTLDVQTLDDGTPPAFEVNYDPVAGATIQGKLPVGLDPAMIGEALALPGITGDVVQGLIGAPMEIGVFASLSQWLPDLERLQVSASPAGTQVLAEVGQAADFEAVQAGMAQDLGPDVALNLTVAGTTGVDGDQRVNIATGETQRYGGGYWLAVPDFTFDRSTCQAETQKVLDGAQVTFVTGSDVLDASAKAILNDLASVMAECARAGGLRAVIGGHTDAVGDDIANLGLSQKRATAVRLALVARGVPGAAIKAIGFGETQPIADNETDEGRARNRRTSVEWVE